MHAFRLLYPEMDIQIVATQRMEHGLPDEADFAVVFGTRGEFGGDAKLLLPEKVVPVCTQGFLDRNGPFSGPAELAKARLLHLDTRGPSPWFDWKSYLAELGIGRDTAAGHGELSFNTYSLVVQAAIGEQGLAIGWLGLVDSLLSSRMLVTAGPMLEAQDRGYWLLPPKSRSAETDRLVSLAELRGSHGLILPWCKIIEKIPAPARNVMLQQDDPSSSSSALAALPAAC